MKPREIELVDVCKSISAKIYMAGDYSDAKRFCRQFCLHGMCVSIQKTDYIYTMGEEAGFVVQIINYPRFQKTEEEVYDVAVDLAESLILELHQGSCSIVMNDETYFLSRREQDFL